MVRIFSVALLLLLLILAVPTLVAAGPIRWLHPSAAPETVSSPPAPEDPGPVQLSLLDVLGKVSIAVLLVYALAFVLSRCRGASLRLRSGGRSSQPTTLSGVGLRICEACPLPRQEGTLYLIECAGQSLLLGASAQQLDVLWSPPPPENTSRFAPVAAVEEAPTTTPGARYVAFDELPAPRPPVRPAKPESEWARERSRLIHALMQGE